MLNAADDDGQPSGTVIDAWKVVIEELELKESKPATKSESNKNKPLATTMLDILSLLRDTLVNPAKVASISRKRDSTSALAPDIRMDDTDTDADTDVDADDEATSFTQRRKSIRRPLWLERLERNLLDAECKDLTCGECRCHGKCRCHVAESPLQHSVRRHLRETGAGVGRTLRDVETLLGETSIATGGTFVAAVAATAA